MLVLLTSDGVPGQDNDTKMIPMRLQGSVRLEALVNELAPQLEAQFLYDATVARRSVTVKTPAEIPRSVLKVLFGSLLKSEGLAIVDSNVPGRNRIIDVAQMPQYARLTDKPLRDPENPAEPVTRVFRIQHGNVADASKILESFRSSEKAKVLPVGEKFIIMIDFAKNVELAEQILSLIDRPSGEIVYRFYEVENQRSETLSTQVTGMLSEQSEASANEGLVQLFDLPQGNRIAVAGTVDRVRQAIELLEKLDISLGIKTRVYRLKHIGAERMNKIVNGYLAPQDKERLYKSTIDESGNLLVVRATEKIHQQIDKLVDELDLPVKSTQSPIRFYKLKNANALEVLYTLLALQEATIPTGFDGAFTTSPFANFGEQPTNLLGRVTPRSSGSVSQAASSPLPLQVDDGSFGTNLGDDLDLLRLRIPAGPTGVSRNGSNQLAQVGSGVSSNGGGGIGAFNALASGFASAFGAFGGGNSGGFARSATLPGGARVSADVATNSIIVVAPASVQPMYAQLIESLDQRRPQVLIEAKIVAVDTTDNFGLGVEVSAGDRIGDRRLFQFTSFGLSEVDRDTGALRILPALGFNGTLIDPDVADVVVQALARHSRGTVLAAPKILVNDNSTGKLESVVSVPFQSVNASETVATTSLGGDQQAGTVITVTPHINEDDHLQLEFDVEFSTFNGTGTENLPPPRQIDRVGSIVTIPDGKTVIVGGLRRIGESQDFIGVPWAEKIPVIRELSSRTTETLTTTSFFLFIRPQVLRDSRFQDLRFLSDRESSQAGLPGEYPVSGPVLIP